MSVSLPPCKTCVYWGTVRVSGFAECYRYPPPRPRTAMYDACGEHKPLPTQENT